ncbi:DNA repair protein RecN, partial [Candidatus Desantisbacteria bacterium]|nr:DNA repair protein RecN [Candidatus Desantisbacteria bacterium]
LDIVKQELKNISLMDASLKEHLTICENTIIELKEVGISILRYHDSIEFSNELQVTIEERISAIQSIKKKYGNTVSEILLYRENIQKELDELNNIEENFNDFIEQLEKLKKEIILKSQNLSEKRKESAKLFNTKVEKELKDLGMEKSKFIANLQKEEITGSDGIAIENNYFRLFPWGMDKVEFLISPNPGEEIKPLSKIASGGEISRIMLALKTICTHEDKAATIVFDEIDVGVGGEMANKIGKKLQAISSKFQVICITHLPQIACLADHHFNIYKKIKDGRTVTELNQLDTKSRIQEIARMISGDKITDLTLKHAQELIMK